MFLDGKTDVLPAENTATHDKALAIADKLQKLVEADDATRLEDLDPG